MLWGSWPSHVLFSSVQFSRSVVSDSLRPHESQHTRPPCPSPTPGVHPNSCASSRWCHPAISSSVVPFSSCPQSLSASGSSPMSQLFACIISGNENKYTPFGRQFDSIQQNYIDTFWLSNSTFWNLPSRHTFNSTKIFIHKVTPAAWSIIKNIGNKFNVHTTGKELK